MWIYFQLHTPTMSNKIIVISSESVSTKQTSYVPLIYYNPNYSNLYLQLAEYCTSQYVIYNYQFVSFLKKRILGRNAL